MALRINDTAPNFTAQTTTGADRFPSVDRRQVGDPVFPPQGLHAGLHHRARLHGQDRARVHQARRQAHRLSVDPSEAHARWLADIEETQGAKVNYPIIADHDLKVAKLYDMLPAEEPGTSEGRTAATNQTVRTVYVIGPDKKIKLTCWPIR